MQSHGEGLGAETEFSAAAGHVELFEVGELAEGLVETLVGYGFADEA